jgi:hypothetical protein
MEATSAGPNRTGTTAAPDGLKLMLDAVDEFSPPETIDTSLMEGERKAYIVEADSVGSIPPAQGAAAVPSGDLDADLMNVFLDKLGERIAFERTGTRLYDALIVKYLAFHDAGGSGSNKGARAARASGKADRGDGNGGAAGAAGAFGLEVLRKIRADELSHFQLLCESMKSLGGDPTAQTPCADVVGTASAGILQVVSDPRTTLAQSLNAVLSAELTDNASWELLCELAEEAGHAEMAKKFEGALANEAEHLATVRGWLESLVMSAPNSAAV